jgi:hypothetical protein
MTDGTWMSALPGAVAGIAYGITSWWMVRRAVRRSPKTFLLLVMGGMLLRLLAASIIVVAVLVWLPVHPAIFIGTFFGFFVIALVAEVITLHRRQRAAGPPTT